MGGLPSLNSMYGRQPLSRCVSSHEQQWPVGSSKSGGLCTALHAQCAKRLPGLIRPCQLALSCLKQSLVGCRIEPQHLQEGLQGAVISLDLRATTPAELRSGAHVSSSSVACAWVMQQEVACERSLGSDVPQAVSRRQSQTRHLKHDGTCKRSARRIHESLAGGIMSSNNLQMCTRCLPKCTCITSDASILRS